MKILLLGCDGQVGWELQRSLAVLGEVTALGRDARRNPGGLTGDLTDEQGLRATFRAIRPQAVVNAAAHTAVDKAESEPQLARAVNATAPGLLAREAASLDAWLVHYSTDYVFDGGGVNPYVEDDPAGPLNVYGHTKLEGEDLIRASGCRHLILRTSWVFSARGNNFARTILRLAAERKTLNVIDDQIGAPTGADLLADVTAHALHQAMLEQNGKALSGTYHCVAGGATSWSGYARHVIGWAAARGRNMLASADGVNPIPSSAYKVPARRPLNSRLSTEKLQKTFGLTMPPWQLGVERMLDEFLDR